MTNDWESPILLCFACRVMRIYPERATAEVCASRVPVIVVSPAITVNGLKHRLPCCALFLVGLSGACCKNSGPGIVTAGIIVRRCGGCFAKSGGSNGGGEGSGEVGNVRMRVAAAGIGCREERCFTPQKVGGRKASWMSLRGSGAELGRRK